MCFYLNNLNYLPNGHYVSIYVGVLKGNERIWKLVGKFTNLIQSVFYTFKESKTKQLYVGFEYHKK